MIDHTQLTNAAAAYARDKAGAAVVGVQVTKGQLPRYSSPTGGTAICTLARQDGRIGGVCREFYQRSDARSGATVCPWGIELAFARVENPLTVIGIFVQRGYDQEQLPRITSRIRDYPRKPKKAANDAIAATSNRSYPSQRDADLLDSFTEVVNTLLTGRAADAVRAIAHEIQSPVQGAVTDVTYLRELATGGELPAQAVSVVERIARNLDSVLAHARQIPLLATPDIKVHPAQIRKVYPHGVIEDIAHRLGHLAEERGIKIRRRYNVSSATLEAVPDQFEMVLYNLLQNAIKYSFQKSEGEQYVTLELNATKETVEISVENVGPLITDDEIRTGVIFQLGYRGAYSSDRGRTGSGAGLFIAHRVTSGHGGSIIVSSRPLVSHDTPACFNRFVVRWPVSTAR
jgi:signal transduction histidine kinase